MMLRDRLLVACPHVAEHSDHELQSVIRMNGTQVRVALCVNQGGTFISTVGRRYNDDTLATCPSILCHIRPMMTISKLSSERGIKCHA